MKLKREIDFEETIIFQDIQEAQVISKKEKQIIDAYFILKLKPREIPSRFFKKVEESLYNC